MLLLDKSVCTPDAQCNAKMCALAESLQRMYDITSPKRASPRRNTYVYIYIYIYIPLDLTDSLANSWLASFPARIRNQMPGLGVGCQGL